MDAQTIFVVVFLIFLLEDFKVDVIYYNVKIENRCRQNI